ncbi:hypothetical protein [Mucisphaera sp.]|uniref:hypothetical protein n=1 Tax=Mucisphaera sp. TaxID=2913024 RepID=UPI003D106CF3
MRTPIEKHLADVEARDRAIFNNDARGTRCSAFGVDYLRFDEPDGGQLYVTRYGYRVLPDLKPDAWYHPKRYRTEGQKLAGGTGSVFRMPALGVTGKHFDMVVKFSRFAQKVPLFIATHILKTVQTDWVENARFNNPFEEFGSLVSLRRAQADQDGRRIRTGRALAIYTPGRRFPIWQLDRTRSRFIRHENAVDRDQAKSTQPGKIKLEIDRDYIVLYEWVKGDDAEDLYSQGIISEKTLLELSDRVQHELDAAGFYVLDNKPKHYILRRRHDGKTLLQRHGELVYTLIDFELLRSIERKEPETPQNPT